MTTPSFFIPESCLIEKLAQEFDIEMGDDEIDNIDVFMTLRDGLRSDAINKPDFKRFLNVMKNKTEIDALDDPQLAYFMAACHYYYGF